MKPVLLMIHISMIRYSIKTCLTNTRHKDRSEVLQISHSRWCALLSTWNTPFDSRCLLSSICWSNLWFWETFRPWSLFPLCFCWRAVDCSSSLPHCCWMHCCRSFCYCMHVSLSSNKYSQVRILDCDSWTSLATYNTRVLYTKQQRNRVAHFRSPPGVSKRYNLHDKILHLSNS